MATQKFKRKKKKRTKKRRRRFVVVKAKKTTRKKGKKPKKVRRPKRKRKPRFVCTHPEEYQQWESAPQHWRHVRTIYWKGYCRKCGGQIFKMFKWDGKVVNKAYA